MMSILNKGISIVDRKCLNLIKQQSCLIESNYYLITILYIYLYVSC